MLYWFTYRGGIAKVAVFLASDDEGWVNGEKINVSGGLRL